jgi:GNAT superfamily N-acetyltransferase
MQWGNTTLSHTTSQPESPLNISYAPSDLANSLVRALIDNPFYQAISIDARDEMLRQYFTYSMEEGRRLGRCVCSPDNRSAAAIWVLPSEPDAEADAHLAKERFLNSVLGPIGWENYRKIIDFMTPRTSDLINQSAWYLSIIGVSPASQGKGLGATLLQPTLLEADKAGAPCYLETFTPRNVKFYERIGFVRLAAHLEPVTNSEYLIMIRRPTDE